MLGNTKARKIEINNDEDFPTMITNQVSRNIGMSYSSLLYGDNARWTNGFQKTGDILSSYNFIYEPVILKDFFTTTKEDKYEKLKDLKKKKK